MLIESNLDYLLDQVFYKGSKFMNIVESDVLKRRTAYLSVISNTVLVILKLCVGLYVGAVSLVSEAMHSGVDLIPAKDVHTKKTYHYSYRCPYI